MKVELAISISAIVISAFTFGLALYVALRDRPRLDATAQIFQHPETGQYYRIYIKAVNKGRRPIIVTMLEGTYRKNVVCGEYIDHKNRGQKLEEGEFIEYEFTKYDGIMVCSLVTWEDMYELENLKIVDSANRKYRIKDAKKLIQKLWDSKQPLGKH